MRAGNATVGFHPTQDHSLNTPLQGLLRAQNRHLTLSIRLFGPNGRFQGLGEFTVLPQRMTGIRPSRRMLRSAPRFAPRLGAAITCGTDEGQLSADPAFLASLVNLVPSLKAVTCYGQRVCPKCRFAHNRLSTGPAVHTGPRASLRVGGAEDASEGSLQAH